MVHILLIFKVHCSYQTGGLLTGHWKKHDANGIAGSLNGFRLTRGLEHFADGSQSHSMESAHHFSSKLDRNSTADVPWFCVPLYHGGVDVQ